MEPTIKAITWHIFSRVDGAATLVACHVLASSATQFGKKKRTTCLTGTTCRSFFCNFFVSRFFVWRRTRFYLALRQRKCVLCINLDDYESDLTIFYGTNNRKKAAFRRKKAAELHVNPDKWAVICFNTISEIMEEQYGEVCIHDKENRIEFCDFDVRDTLVEFVRNKFFCEICKLLLVGKVTKRIVFHDKLDPIMLVAYAERFQDGMATDLWKKMRKCASICQSRGNNASSRVRKNHAISTK